MLRSGFGAPARTAMAMLERATGVRLSANTKPSAMNLRSIASATITMSATSPFFSRFGIDVSPVPIDVVTVTIVFFGQGLQLRNQGAIRSGEGAGGHYSDFGGHSS